MVDQHAYFMKKAINKAKIGISKGQTPFGACLVIKGQVIVAAHNQVWATTDITAHAEITAIRKACRKLNTVDLSEAVIYSTCEPCPMCFSAIHWARIPAIIYGAAIGDAKAYGFNELAISNTRMKAAGQSPIHITSGVERKAVMELFEQWQQLQPRTY